MSGIVFLVDTTDKERVSEAKAELDGILSNEFIKHIPVLVLGNKIDVPRAFSEDQLRDALGLHEKITTGKVK